MTGIDTDRRSLKALFVRVRRYTGIKTAGIIKIKMLKNIIIIKYKYNINNTNTSSSNIVT